MGLFAIVVNLFGVPIVVTGSVGIVFALSILAAVLVTAVNLMR